MTLAGVCQSIFGCINFFTDPNQGVVCTACNLSLNLYLNSSYSCSCIKGFTYTVFGGAPTCF